MKQGTFNIALAYSQAQTYEMESTLETTINLLCDSRASPRSKFIVWMMMVLQR